MPPTHHPVARAQLGEVTDRQLAQLRNLAHAARSGDISAAEAEYLLTACGPLLDELIERRQIDDQVARLFTTGGARVIPFHGGA